MNTIIDWKDMYSVGNAELDLQHKKLFDLINALYASYQTDKAHPRVKETLDELVAYVNYHFSFEEDLMQKCNYPDYERHCGIHRKMTDNVKEMLKKQSELESGAMVMELTPFLRKWITQHILRTDKHYSSYIKS